MDTFISNPLGLDAKSLSVAQMCLRAIVVYILALLLVRVAGNLRFAGKYAAIDIVLSITLGATLSRAIIGAAEFFPTLAAGVALVSCHGLIAKLSFYFPKIEGWVKGKPRLLIQSGKTNRQALQNASLTSQDLDMVLRSQGIDTDQAQVERAVLEPNGNISITVRSENASQ